MSLVRDAGLWSCLEGSSGCPSDGLVVAARCLEWMSTLEFWLE